MLSSRGVACAHTARARINNPRNPTRAEDVPSVFLVRAHPCSRRAERALEDLIFDMLDDENPTASSKKTKAAEDAELWLQEEYDDLSPEDINAKYRQLRTRGSTSGDARVRKEEAKRRPSGGQAEGKRRGGTGSTGSTQGEATSAEVVTADAASRPSDLPPSP